MEAGMRRRETPAYTELELECRLDAGSFVGVVYLLETSESSYLVAASFGQLFIPLERETRALDARRQKLVIQELDRKRPLFMGHSKNAALGDYGNGAIIEYEDPGDGVTKYLFALAEGNRFSREARLDARAMNTVGWVLHRSLEILDETSVPLDMASVAQAAERAEMLHNLGAGAKWAFENFSTIKDIISALG
jgi:hypothetical protein